MYFVNCKNCKKEFIARRKSKPGIYCSSRCSIDKRTFWNIATEEQKIDRMRILFEKKVIRRDGCWEWNGGKNLKGYGVVKSGCDNQINASRASWIVHNGPIKNGLFVLHKCDNRICTNPDHLFLGTCRDNIRDMMSKKRNRQPKGENCHKAKLTYENVKKIRLLIKENIPYKQIREEFGISTPTICNIKYRNTWRDI